MTLPSPCSWNGAGQLTAYSDPAASMSAATYDGNGNRASDITGSGTQNFVWDTNSQIPELLMDSNNAYLYTGGQAPAEQVNLSTGTITYLVADMLGSVRGAVSSSGSLNGTTNYDAWGNPESSGGLTAASSRRAATLAMPRAWRPRRAMIAFLTSPGLKPAGARWTTSISARRSSRGPCLVT
jgi:YD repeat-containing protein